MIQRTLNQAVTYVTYPIAQTDNVLLNTVVEGTLTADAMACQQLQVNGLMDVQTMETVSMTAETCTVDTLNVDSLVLQFPVDNSSAFGYSKPGVVVSYPLTSGDDVPLATLSLTPGTYAVNVGFSILPVTDPETVVTEYMIYVVELEEKVVFSNVCPVNFTGSALGPYFAFSNCFIYTNSSNVLTTLTLVAYINFTYGTAPIETGQISMNSFRLV